VNKWLAIVEQRKQALIELIETADRGDHSPAAGARADPVDRGCA
jgi:hypothetical protein